METTNNFLTITINKNNKQLLQDVAQHRTFKSGKQGYGVYGKMADITTGKRYQLSINIVEIVEKPGTASPVKITKDATLVIAGSDSK